MEKSIFVENLSKKYDISKLKKDTQFREALVNFAKRTFLGNDDRKEEVWALKDVSFSVEKGEIVGIIGRNGAGKSTLLKILSKITYPTSGKMKILGQVGSLLEVGTGFHEELSGRENIYLNGSILGMRKKEVKEKLDAIVEFAEVGRFLDTPIKYYSSGMRLKLGFSVAAHLDTDILFVDEVLAVGDVAFQKKCLDTMKDLRTTGRTVIFVSHTMATVENLCPRVLWFDQGKLRQDGPVAEVIHNYITEFAAVVQESKFDLTNVAHRQGNGKIRYTGIEFLDKKGDPKDVIRSGDSLKVRLRYQVFEPAPRPEFYFRFYTDSGVKVATFGTLLSGHEIPILYPGTGWIDVDIDFFNLMPDRYYISAWINSTNMLISDTEVQYDGLERCTAVDVEGSDYYESGKGIDKWWGVIFLPCVWNFDGSKNGRQTVGERTNSVNI